MKIWFSVLAAAAATALSAATPPPPRIPMTRYTMSAGDLTGEGIAEPIVYHSDSKALRAYSYNGPAPVEMMALSVKDAVTRMVAADLDGDGKAELITGDGLRGDNRAECPQTDASIYKPAANGEWGPLEVYRNVYERTENGWRGMTATPPVQTFAARDFDGDWKREMVFTGAPPMPFSPASHASQSDARLGEHVETAEVDAKTLVGKPAPALEATEWLGKPKSLASLKGKVVLIDFWATWCKPCIEMYPEMRKWVSEFGPRGLLILGITNHSRQTSAQVRRFVTRNKLPWTVGIDPKNMTQIAYGVSPIPHTFLIDRNGIVRLQHVGGGDLTPIKSKIIELLAEQPKEAK